MLPHSRVRFRLEIYYWGCIIDNELTPHLGSINIYYNYIIVIIIIINYYIAAVFYFYREKYRNMLLVIIFNNQTNDGRF